MDEVELVNRNLQVGGGRGRGRRRRRKVVS